MYQSVRSHVHLMVMLFMIILGLSACDQEPKSAVTQGDASPAKADGSNPPQTSVRLDLSTFDVCDRVPAREVALILGSSPERTSAKATMGTYATDCTYTLESNDGMKRYAMVWLYPPQMWAPKEFGEVEKIEGLGDDAYLVKDATGSYVTIYVLIDGDFVLDTRAASLEQARGMAELALSRLSSDGG